MVLGYRRVGRWLLYLWLAAGLCLSIVVWGGWCGFLGVGFRFCLVFDCGCCLLTVYCRF